MTVKYLHDIKHGNNTNLAFKIGYGKAYFHNIASLLRMFPYLSQINLRNSDSSGDIT